MITIYKNVYEKKDGLYRDIDFILGLIKSGNWSNKIHQLRQVTDTAIKGRLKCDLPSICFSGKFGERTDEGIIEHSGFAVIDFDHVEKLQELKDQICKDEYTYSCFISPSGDGLKAIIKIPAIITDHEKHYLAIIKKYPSLDTTSRNISRVCFVSYDPELYLNKDSKVFTEKVESAELKKEVKNQIIFSAQKTDYKKLDVICEMVRNSVDGSKHLDLIRASRLAGGFISGGLVEEYEAVRLLELEINKKGILDFKGAQKTIQDGIEYGKREPIYEKTYVQRLQEIIKQDIIIEDEPARDVIYLEDVRDKIIYSYENGTSRGESTHFPDLDNHFRMKRGEISLFAGIGNHGKSTFAYQLALNKAVKDNYKFGIFSPENMPVEEFYKDLIHSYIGKSTEKHHSNQMTPDELSRGASFIADHFFLIYPESDSPTPEYMNNRFRELIIKHNIDGCIIDPYNQLDNDLSTSNGREDQYLSKFLSNSKRFAVEQNTFFWIITHPKGGLLKAKGSEDYNCPTVFDLAGGAMWNNKIDNIIMVHRPFYTSNKMNTSVTISVQKIKKQKLNGIPGDVCMNFDRMRSRYVQVDCYNPLDEPMKVINKLNPPLEPNDNFERELPNIQPLPDKTLPF